MTTAQALAILKAHNAWRRGEIDLPPARVEEIGEAIDVVVKRLSRKSGRKPHCPRCGHGRSENWNSSRRGKFFKCVKCKCTFLPSGMLAV